MFYSRDRLAGVDALGRAGRFDLRSCQLPSCHSSKGGLTEHAHALTKKGALLLLAFLQAF